MYKTLLIGAFVMLGGCAAAGTAPAISNLTITPQTIPAGSAQRVDATLSFTDPDADVIEAIVALTGPLTNVQTAIPVMGSGTAATAGTASLMLTVTIPAAGVVTTTVRLRDSKGNLSNTLSQTFTAQ